MKELSWRERGRLWLRLGIRLVILLAVCGFAVKIAPPLMGLFMPFVVALVLTWMLNPAIAWLEKKMKIGRGALSLALVLLALLAAGSLAVWLVVALVGQVAELLQNWESWWGGILDAIDAFSAAVDEPLSLLPGVGYDRLMELGSSLTGWLGDAVPKVLAGAAGNAGSLAMSLPSVAISVVMCIMATYFISADYPALRRRAVGIIPAEFHGFFRHVKEVARAAFCGYIRAQLILSIGVFFIVLLGFVVTGESYALLLAFALAVMDFIPIIGAGTAMVPWAVVDVVLGNFGHAAGLMAIWGVIVIFRRVGEPKVVGDQTGLSPVASLASIYAGMKLGGVPGMVLGPVICLTVVNVARGGLFDGTRRDLRLALRDTQAFLRNGG